MTWVSWRQFRGAAWVAAAGLAGLAVIYGWTGPHLRHAYHLSVSDSCLGGCSIAGSYPTVRLVNTGLVALPAILGAFWGAPLVARELETGTYRLAWTQSVSRTRWLAQKIGVVGLAALLVSAAWTVAVNWWASPLDSVNANRFSAGQFGQRGIVPVAYTAFAIALGVLLGTVLRRSLPAMAATLAVFTALRVAITLWVRPHFRAAVRVVSELPVPSPGRPVELHSSVSDTGAWILTQRITDPQGRSTDHLSIDDCANAGGAAGQCLGRLRSVETFQPAGRFWQFQWIESGLFVALAAVLVAASFWWVRRRLS